MLLNNYNFSQKIKERVLNQIEHHHWFEKYNTGQISADDVVKIFKTEEDLNDVLNNLISVTIEYDNNEYKITIENQNVFITPYCMKEVFLISKDKETLVTIDDRTTSTSDDNK